MSVRIGRLFHWGGRRAKAKEQFRVSRPKDPFLFKLLAVRKVFFSGGHQIIALTCQQLIILPKKIIGVVGESGSGKSTLLHLLGAIYQPDEGRLDYQAEDGSILEIGERSFPQDYYRLSQIGWVFQDLNLVSHLRVWENVALPLFLRGERWRQKKKEVCQLLSDFGIAETAEKRPAELSGGEQQRVAICRALIAKPRVILADEPTGNLDGSNTQAVMEALKDANSHYGISVIIVTHNSVMAKRYCDSLIICRKTKAGNVIECKDKESDEVFEALADPGVGSKLPTKAGGLENENKKEA